MSDLEVEQVLREIRERVRAESLIPETTGPVQMAATGDGDGASMPTRVVSDALSAMEASLITSDRSRDRLPPLLSYRRGRMASLELWLKRKIKRAAHWFTWEQVNFNSSVYYALREAMTALAAHERSIATQSAELARVRSNVATQQSELETRLLDGFAAAKVQTAAVEAKLATVEAKLAGVQATLAAVESRVLQELTEFSGQLSTSLEELRDIRNAANDAAAAAAIETLQAELRERSANVLDELRVCFKQLSLEAQETAVAQERTRRRLEERLEELEKRTGDD